MYFNPDIIYHVKYITTDNLVPGDFVVAYNYGAGEIRVKKAVVNPYLLVVGFVRSAYSAGMEIYLYRLEFINDKLSGLVVGDDYYAHPTIPGSVTNVVPTGVFVAQKLGKAISPTKLDTRYNELVYIGAGGSPGGPAGGDLSGAYPNPNVVWANGTPTYDLSYYPLSSNPAGYLTGITALDVTTALGYTPYDSTNPAGYITSAALTPYLTSATAALTYLTIASATLTYVPLTRNLTINGTTFDLSLDRTWSVGTVTSVGISAPTEITVGSSPVTGSGTISLSWTNQLANVVFAGPSTGAATTPTFRSLVAADIPSLSYISTTLNSGEILVGNGSNIATAVSMSGDATISSTGALTISNGAVNYDKLADEGELSIISAFRFLTGN